MREPTPEEIALYDAVTRRVRPAVIDVFGPDSTFATCKIAIDVLRHFGVDTVQPYPIVLAVFNKPFADEIRRGIHPTKVTRSDAPGGPWSVGLGTPVPGQPFIGHLVVGDPTTGFLADLAIDRVSRPERGLSLTPYWKILPDPAWFADPRAFRPVDLDGGAMLLLDRLNVRDPLAYQQSRNWHGEPAGDIRSATDLAIGHIASDLSA